MPRKLRFPIPCAVVLMALTLSAMWTSPALADDATPPPVDTPVEAAPPAGEAVVADDAAAMPEILEQFPEGTEVMVVDESGEVIPLATEEAAQIIWVGDPIWCPTGVAPKPGVGGCSSSQPNLSTLVGAFVPTKAGTIWIENIPDSGSDVVIDGTGTWAPAANFSLTLQGGWIGGITGSKTILGVSTFNTAINIINWNGAVTVNDITMNGATNAAFPSTGALYVETSKNIVLSNVTAINTIGGASSGVNLDNTSSTTQATVTVKNSSFNNNANAGLAIYSDGAVTLTNVNANNNVEQGVYIENNSDTLASPVTVTKSSFNGNNTAVTPISYGGLEIRSNGAVKLDQVTANDNGQVGVYVNNYGGTSAQPVTVTGFLTALNNAFGGLEISSKGTVNLTNLTTSLNGGSGTFINNSFGTPMAVKITGTNIFNYNFNNGLFVVSRGAITLNNLTVIQNGILSDFDGVYVHNDLDTSKPQSITLTGYNTFLKNGHNGFRAASFGAITLNNVTAQHNGNAPVDANGSGVELTNHGALTTKPANITVNGTNSFTHNDADGLYAASIGIITISNITASYNGGRGTSLYNAFAGVYKAVVLKGNNNFNQNSSDGLRVISVGTITLNNVTAYSNLGYGAYLVNSYGVQSAVMVNGYGLFESNNEDGLYVNSNGAITTKNLTANFNVRNGASLNTIGVLAPQTVTLNGTNNFNYNGTGGTESGLVVNADGAIKLNNVNASYNYYSGADLDNFTNWDSPVVEFATFGSITLTGFGNFTSNFNSRGLNIYTHGSATLNYVTANYNADAGIGIDADGNVTVVCSSANNNLHGFRMYGAASLLTLKGLYTSGNTGTDELVFYDYLVRTRCP